MKGVAFVVGLLLLSSCQSGRFRHEGEATAVWIDTDPSVGEENRDVDDGLALLQAFYSSELAITGISTVFGNTSGENAYRIGKKIVELFSLIEIEIFRGADGPQDLGRETPAVTALARALVRERLTIVAIGPLTNVASLVKTHPELAKNIVRVIAVAGRRPGQRFTTGVTNPKAHRDFNFEQDPEAFRVLLASEVPLVLAPFEISSRVWMTAKDIDRIEAGGTGSQWIAHASRNWLALWKNTFSVEGFNPFDTLAVAFVTHPALFSCDPLPIAIQILPDDVTEERMQGTRSKTKPYLILSSDLESNRKALYCYRVGDRFKEVLMQRLISTELSNTGIDFPNGFCGASD